MKLPQIGNKIPYNQKGNSLKSERDMLKQYNQSIILCLRTTKGKGGKEDANYVPNQLYQRFEQTGVWNYGNSQHFSQRNSLLLQRHLQIREMSSVPTCSAMTRMDAIRSSFYKSAVALES